MSQNSWNIRSRRLNIKNQLRSQYENLGKLMVSKGYLEISDTPIPEDIQIQEILNKIKELEKSLAE